MILCSESDLCVCMREREREKEKHTRYAQNQENYINKEQDEPTIKEEKLLM